MRRWVLTANQDRTWRVLRDDAGRQGVSRLSLADIQNLTGFTKPAVMRHLATLERLHRILTLDPGGGRGRRACRIVPRHFSYAAWRKRGYVRNGSSLERVSIQPAPVLFSSTEEKPHQKARPVPGSEAFRANGRQSSHAGGRPLGILERDLATREGVDGLYGRLGRAGWLEPCERFREIVHGLVARARRIAQNPLAFVAGVVRRGLWKVVGERDREVARDEIAALDVAAETAAVAETPFVDVSALMELTAQIAQGWTKPMKTDPQQVGNLYSQRVGQARATPTTAEMEHAEEQARQVVQGRYVYGMIYRRAYLTHDHDGPDPTKLTWQPDDQQPHQARRQAWGEWAAWAREVS